MSLAYDPYSKGRWYRFFIESDGTTPTLTESDISDATVSTSALTLPAGYKVVDIKATITNAGSAAGTYTSSTKYGTDDAVAITLPTKTYYSAMYVYVFAYFEE